MVNSPDDSPHLREVCSNCDGVGCMHIVLRDWWAPDAEGCEGCCPFCQNLEDEPVYDLDDDQYDYEDEHFERRYW